MSLTLRHIAHAEALARHRNYREAALELHISQPALTRSIQMLESTLGGLLFDRLSTGIELTQAGETFLARARQVLFELDELETDVGAVLGLAEGSLTVAAGPYPGEKLVPDAVAALVSRYPGINYRLRELDWGRVPEALLHREVDIAFADLSDTASDPRFATELLIKDKFYYICRGEHPLASPSAVPLEVVAQFPLVANTAPRRMKEFFHQNGPSGSVDPVTGNFHPKIEVTTFGATKRILFSTDSIALAPLLQVESELASGALTIIRTEPLPLNMNSGFIYLAGRTPSPIMVEFMQQARQIKIRMDSHTARIRHRFGIE